MSDSEHTKEDAPKHPSLDDQPTSAERGTLPLKRGSAAVRHDTPLPSLQDRYEILGEAGRGGMGVVYRARDRETNESVALKILKPEIANEPAVIERFKDELKLARKVTHKNVCRIHEFNRAADGSAYISMEFVEGDSLRRILARFGGLPLRKGIQVAGQICAGLGEAHAQGVVHRDLKPENIMLDEAGNVKIMDFGIARSLEEGTTRSSGILGTPAYMSPEQAEGKSIDLRTDIYSLGLILYEIFTGSKAFSGQTPVEVALKQVHETPSAPRMLEPTLPPEIEKAILKCLEKNPAKRFQSTEQLETALTRPELEKPVTKEVEDVKMPVRLAFWQRSDWYLLGAGVLGTVLFFVLFYRFHPATVLKIDIDAERQRQIVAEAVKKLGWNARVESPTLGFWPDSYYAAASTLGNGEFSHGARGYGSEMGGWSGDMTFPWTTSGPHPRPFDHLGTYSTLLDGEVARLFSGEGLSDSAAEGTQAGPRPDDAAMARMVQLAGDAIGKVFGVDLASATPLVTSHWNKDQASWIYSFAWKVSSGRSKASTEELTAVVRDRDVILLIRQQENPRLMNQVWRDSPFQLQQSFQFQPSSLSAGPAVLIFALFLFVARKLYRAPRPRANLWVAGCLAVVTASVVTEFRSPSAGLGGPALNIVMPPLIFCISFLICYAALATLVYYSKSRFPAQVGSYLQLFREHVLARGPGLSILRGIFIGLTFSSCWMTLVALGGIRGNWLPSTYRWLGELVVPTEGMWGQILTQTNWWTGQGTDFSGSFYFVSLMPIVTYPVFPLLLLGESFVAGLLLVLFPMSLLGRITRRPQVLLVLLAGLWVAFGYTLAGAAVFPQLPYYVFAALQAIILGAIFLRYDLLSTLSAIFTIEVNLLAFPLWTIFRNIGSGPYLITIGLWLLLLVTASILYFRPHLVSAYRRVAAVFE